MSNSRRTLLSDRLVSLRKAYGRALQELGDENTDIVVLDADLSKSTQTHMFASKHRNRFFNMGIAEQDMMGTAVGLASCGKIVFVSTFAIFATGRAWEQIRNSVCYTGSNVNVVATHGGISVGPDGSSHQALEDVALMRVIPNMKVVVPCDDIETGRVIHWAAKEQGPKYIRLNRSDSPRIYREGWKFEEGRGMWLRRGKDVTVIANGIMVSKALEAAEILETDNVSAGVINMSSVKPIDVDSIREAALETGRIVTAEEHSIIGGLASAVAEVLSREPIAYHRAVGVQNTFGESGSIDELLEKYGLTTNDIIREATELMKMKPPRKRE
jgi:transketolase